MNKRNYQLELDRKIKAFTENGERPRLLLHACCAPCSSYCLEYLSRYFDITVFFYNPNMDTEEEYERRFAELERFIKSAPLSSEVKLVKGDYEPELFQRIAEGHENDPERGARCMLCYELRLRKTAEYMKASAMASQPEALADTYSNAQADESSAARADVHSGVQADIHSENNNVAFDYFTTTLTISPLKNAEALNSIGERIASEYGLSYLTSDFKKKEGYKRSIELSREYELYRQDYCGCVYSRQQREREIAKNGPGAN